MDSLKDNKKTIFVCILLIIVVLGLYYLNNFKNNRGDGLGYEADIEISRYDANQYIPIYMTEEDIIKKYLNDFKNLMIYDIEEAFYTLNEEYRTLKYDNINDFIEYVNSIKGVSLYNLSVDKYVVKSIDGNKFFDVEASNGERYIFKEISIMNYEVYLDSYTAYIG